MSNFSTLFLLLQMKNSRRNPALENPPRLSSMLNKATRRHLLDFYDGRFCQTDFIFWLFNILTRHTEIKNSSIFLKHKHRTKARVMFEELCNTENLESQLEYAKI